MLGKNRSMDVLDPTAMRMMAFNTLEYGMELAMTEVLGEEEHQRGMEYANIYDETTWC